MDGIFEQATGTEGQKDTDIALPPGSEPTCLKAL